MHLFLFIVVLPGPGAGTESPSPLPGTEAAVAPPDCACEGSSSSREILCDFIVLPTVLSASKLWTQLFKSEEFYSFASLFFG